MGKPTIYSEVCFIPKCTPEKGKPWFAVKCLDWTASGARNHFVEQCFGKHPETGAWKSLRIEGWRIVKVKVVTS